jgi:hypothetical protein
VKFLVAASFCAGGRLSPRPGSDPRAGAAEAAAEGENLM